MSKEKHIAEVASLYDELAANGPYGTLAPGNRGGAKSRYVSEVFDAALLPVLARDAAPGDHLLDYGCGTGIFSVKAARHVARVTGLDVSPSMLDWGRRLARGHDNLDWLLGDGETIALPDASVQWVVARESLCYVTADRLPGVVAEIARVLAPGGRFLWLEQVSDNPKFQNHPSAPLLEKRPAQALLEIAGRAGLETVAGHCVRQPRFPWIYLVWAGLVPGRWLPALARREVAFHRRFGRLRAPRWKDALLDLRKPA